MQGVSSRALREVVAAVNRIVLPQRVCWGRNIKWRASFSTLGECVGGTVTENKAPALNEGFRHR
jgi:hypothetical protein